VEVQLTDSSDSHYRENASSIASNMKTVEECQDLIESLGLESTDLPFLQHFNTWRAENATTVKKLCLSAYLAQSASVLLDTPTVRLYQDSLFHKRRGDGWTPYHSVITYNSHIAFLYFESILTSLFLRMLAWLPLTHQK
jgi:hypothetical protein